MVHPTDSELLALLHGERSESEPAEVRGHLTQCEPCRTRQQALTWHESEIASLLALLDEAAPEVSLSTITRRADAARRSRALAAGLAALIVAATAAAAVIPGSPLHPYFRTIVGKASLQHRPALRPAPAPADTAGVTVSADSEVTIVLRHPQTAGEIRLAWPPGASSVSVRAVGGRVGYTVGRGRVVVENVHPAERYEIVMPRTVPRATLMVGDKVLWRSSDAGGQSDSVTFDLSNIPKE